MELFRLLGTIAIENSDAISAIKETAEETEKSESKISKAFGKIGDAATKVGKVITTGLAAGAAAMGALLTKSLNAAGDLEQNMGGSEAVFKESAEKMQEAARNAFSNMGLSMSDFLGTANKMGALFQGAGFDIESSADMSASAMQRAADVASIMGIDVNSAMEAVAGMAKGNFTMMDNLGVAINDTTLQIYAQEKGLGELKTTQDKVNAAYQLFMEKSEYAAGNYQKENATFAGAMTTAKAALDNFLSGAGTAEQLANAVVGAADVIIVKINELLPQLITGIQTLINQLMPELPRLLQSVLPGIIQGAVSLVTGLIQALPTIIQLLIEQVPFIVTQIGTALIQTIPVLLESAKQIGSQIMGAISGAVSENGGGVFSGLLDAFGTLKGVVSDVFQNSICPLFQDFMAMGQELWTENQDLINKLGELFSMLGEMLSGIFSVIGELFNWFVSFIRDNMGVVKDIFQSCIDVITGIVDFFISLFKGDWQGMWDAVISILTSAVDIVKNAFTLVKNFIQSILSGIWSKVTEIWENIKLAITQKIESIVDGIKNKFTAAKDAVSEIFGKMKEAVTNIFEGIWNAIKSRVNSIIGGLETMINAVISGINKLLKGVEEVANAAGELLGFDPISISLSTVSLPRLAKGGIVNKPTIAQIGEDGAEAIVPLENNTGWIRKVSDEIQSSGNNEVITLLRAINDKLDNFGDTVRYAIDGTQLNLNNREFARLVKAVN